MPFKLPPDVLAIFGAEELLTGAGLLAAAGAGLETALGAALTATGAGLETALGAAFTTTAVGLEVTALADLAAATGAFLTGAGGYLNTKC